MNLSQSIVNLRQSISDSRAMLVGISGIDASGKGHVSRLLATELESAGYRVGLINVDGWLNLPHVRFHDDAPGEHFYRHALRLDELFATLIRPLKDERSIQLAMSYADETATDFRPHTYSFETVDIILLEGIFIFKREFVDHFDLKIWIDCSFETALQRAIGRRQENLPVDETVRAYETIYFPAQRCHLEIDDPIATADVVYPND